MHPLRNVLFVPHGAPTFALQPGAAGAAMSAMANRLAAPRAVVIMSPHWDTRVPTVSTATQLETIHDFYGFPAELYDIQYPATGCPAVAHELIAALEAAGFEVMDSKHGLDHGAWQPLRQMFPHADVPIVPLSMQTHAGPEHAYRLGQALAPLAAKDSWVVASGNITHNLRDWQVASATDGQTPAYVHAFSQWVQERLSARDVASLLDYRARSSAGRQAHPTEDHLLPLFVALGAATDAKPVAFFRGISDHVIAMDGYAFAN